jgi:uncharacterized protein
MPAMIELDRLRYGLRGIGRVAVAVSGGVDSLTLAAVAHTELGDAARMHHAVSPAVPAEATVRTRELATAKGWVLDVFDAGEFADEAYRANPVNRCLFCKTNLYRSLALRALGQIVSGTNTDDLGEYRPGLQAAEYHGVRHPYIEARIDKAAVRRIAAQIGLGAVADLPAAPCLSSRLETGIRVEPELLAMVHDAERLVADALRPRTVRCRVRRAGIVVELDNAALGRLDGAPTLAGQLRALTRRPVTFAPYRAGSAFLLGVRA